MKKSDYTVVPYNSLRIKDRYLVSNMFGSWDFLNDGEFRTLSTLGIKKDTPLFNRLYKNGIIADEGNIEDLIGQFRNINANLFADTALHIAVVTTRCNLACKYCQTNTGRREDMTYEVAARVVKYLYDVRNNCITLEFQGGEPLLNWDIVVFLIKEARKLNPLGKNLQITMVTNLTLMDDEKMKFLVENNVEICSSLDGPKHIHDKNRIFPGGKKGTYDIVIKKIKRIKSQFGRQVNLLPTITKDSLPFYKEIIDEYVKAGVSEISLRPVNRIGIACANWESLGYTVAEFNDFYRRAMDYILKINKKGTIISERIARVMLEKILKKKDPGYVELMNPCGAGRTTIVYMPDGSCYPCDEARMVNDDMFKLGNILNENYEDLMRKENLLYLLESSVINIWDNKSVFSPWIGTCPIVNYAMQKNVVPKIWCSPIHLIYNYQFRYIFEKMMENKENLNIFRKWIRWRGDEK